MVRHRIFNMNLEHDEKPQRIWTPNQYQPLFVLIVAARPMVASDKCWLRMAGWERGHVRSHDHNSALVIFSRTHDSFKESSRDVFNHLLKPKTFADSSPEGHIKCLFCPFSVSMPVSTSRLSIRVERHVVTWCFTDPQAVWRSGKWHLWSYFGRNEEFVSRRRATVVLTRWEWRILLELHLFAYELL